MGTVGISSRGVIYADPEFLKSRDVPPALLEHEVWHLVLNHAGRASAFRAEQRLWNVAADLEIHGGILRTGSLGALTTLIQHEGSPLTPKLFGFPEGKTAEQYYTMLLQNNVVVVSAEFGSAADGVPRDYEGHVAGDPDCGEMSELQQERLRDEVAKASAGQRPGTVPSGVLCWAASRLKAAKLNWKQVLSRLLHVSMLSSLGDDEPTYSQVNRRNPGGARGYLSPAIVDVDLAVGVVVDTSGSMAGEALDNALSETLGIVRAFGGAVLTLMCDAEVYGWKSVQSAADFDVRGGGGTDMREGIEAAEKNRDVQTVVVITDGDTPWPEHRGRKPLVVVLVDGHRETPSWAKTVIVE
jgi:predicted metal-dependent peptidase